MSDETEGNTPNIENTAIVANRTNKAIGELLGVLEGKGMLSMGETAGLLKTLRGDEL